MKKIIAVAVVALMLCSAVFAQVTVGVRGGLATNMGTKAAGEAAKGLDDMKEMFESSNGTVKTPAIFGASFGAYAKIDVASSIFVQPEVNYNMTNGFKFVATLEDHKMTMTETFATIDIPVLVGYELACGPVTVAPFAGPQVSFVASKIKQVLKSDIPYMEGDESKEIGGKAKPTFGAVIGCGVTYPVADAIVVGADVRYAMDFNALKTKEEGDDEYSDFLKRSGLSLSVSAGYKF